MSETHARTEDAVAPRVAGDGTGNPAAGFEASEADAAEQYQAVREERSAWLRRLPFDADPADAAEQDRDVELDEDDYR